jgi:hypothetical protein
MELKDLLATMPCMNNQERLARLEENVKGIKEDIGALLEMLSKHIDEPPCTQCALRTDMVTVKRDLKAARWFAATTIGAFIVAMAKRYLP